MTKLIEKEISHPTHPRHKLKLESTKTPFRCNGCHEPGNGLKYACERCDFDLHKTCAAAHNTISHPFYHKSEFWLRKVPQLPKKRTCEACRGEVSGVVYQCLKFGFNLHPCCAELPLSMNNKDVVLFLHHKLPGTCRRCGTAGGPGWGYRSHCGTYSFHVSCKKKTLLESYQPLSLNADRNKVREGKTQIPRLEGAVKNVDRGRKDRK